MLDNDIYYVWSIGGTLKGFINLRKAPYVIKLTQNNYDLEDCIFMIKNCKVSKRNIVLAPTSISLVDVGKKVDE